MPRDLTHPTYEDSSMPSSPPPRRPRSNVPDLESEVERLRIRLRTRDAEMVMIERERDNLKAEVDEWCARFEARPDHPTIDQLQELGLVGFLRDQRDAWRGTEIGDDDNADYYAALVEAAEDLQAEVERLLTHIERMNRLANAQNIGPVYVCVPCPTCKGTGQNDYRMTAVLCSTCLGQKVIPVPESKPPPAIITTGDSTDA